MPSCSRLRYLESAPRGAPSQDARDAAGTLVLLHAFPLGARMWEPQHDLADHGWRVIMPHLRGFDCAKPDAEAASIDDYAEDVADLIDTLGVPQVVVGGLSMGGYVALALYRQAPRRFRGLVLADTRPEADTPEARANRMRLIDLAGTAGALAVADDMLPKLLGETTRASQPALAGRVRALAALNQAGAIQSALRAMMTRPDSTTLLPTIDVPTLVVAGEEDVLTPPAVGAAMASAIPNALFAVVPRAGHLSSLEQPQGFNAALTRFLDGL
jgi:pimeloyl-ACP methyl ester carboxylesterase